MTLSKCGANKAVLYYSLEASKKFCLCKTKKYTKNSYVLPRVTLIC